MNQSRLVKINNIYVEAQLAIEGLTLLSARYSDKSISERGRTFYAVVPSTKAGKETNITRKPDIIVALIADRVSSKEYLQSMVFAIALTEDYINEVLTLVLEAYPQKLSLPLKSKDGRVNSDEKAILLTEIIKSESLEGLYRDQARIRSREAMYASPREYMSYLSSVLSFDIPEATVSAYAELKATRDLYIHGDGRINSLYLSKTGRNARGVKGDIASLDQEYFRVSIGAMKAIFTTIYKGMLDKHGDGKTINLILKRRARKAVPEQA